MTVIIALKDEENKKIFLGADRQGTSEDVSFNNFGCKLLKMEIPLSDGNIDSIYIAFSGSTFLHQYLFNVFEAPVFDVETNFINYLYRSFFKELKEELMEQKLIIEELGKLDSEAGLIIVHGEDIFQVYDDFAVVKSPRMYGVGGAGYKYALTVIENNLEFHKDMDYREIVGEALYTTGKLSIYCNTDYDILTIDY